MKLFTILVASIVALIGVIFGATALKSPGAGPSIVRADAAKEKENGKATSWPMFGGTNSRNFVNLVDTNVPTKWSPKKGAELNIKWSAQLGTKAYGGPVVADGKIFVGTNNYVPRNKRDVDANDDPIDKGIVMCFRESDGEFLWQYVSDKLLAGRVSDWPDEGICSSPVVEGKRLYFVTNRCEVLCCTTEGLAAGNEGVTDEKYKDNTDADVVWRLDMNRELGVFPHNLAVCSPLIVGDTLFVITSNGVDENHKNIPAPDAPSFLAIDKKNGKVLWKDNSPGRNIMHGQWSNPVYAEPNGTPMIIFPGGDGWLRAFNPKNGELIWKFDCNPKEAVYVLGPEGTKNDFIATPVVWENKLYVGVGQDPEHKKGVGHFWCIDIAKKPANKDKDLSPATKPGTKEGDPPQSILDPKDPANKDSGLVWHFGGMAPKGANRLYTFGRTLSTVAVHDGLVYAPEFDQLVHCLDANTGEEYWQHDRRADTWGSPYWVDGKVYLGDDSGKITIFKHGKKKEIIGTVDMGRTTHIRATPVVANGVMYVITENPCKLWAIASK
jgi:outer membrane protein assembly factor BamB